MESFRAGRSLSAAALLALAGAVLGGCEPAQPYVTSARLERGLVIVLPGVEGCSPFNAAICEGLDAGGVKYAIELCDWTAPWGPLANLRAEGRNRRQAKDLAARVTAYALRYPENPVVLVGQSGGGAIAVWAAEALPPGGRIDGAILLAPSLSPGYRLDGALENCGRGIVNFRSPRDVVFLGLGTMIAGTMDGEHASSAGRVGFDLPPVGGPRDDAYAKFHQVVWHERMGDSANPGMHVTSGAKQFVSDYVVPLVLARQWDKRLIDTVVRDLPTTAPAAD